MGNQLGLRTDLDAELQNHAVTTLDDEGIQACARGVIAAGKGTGRFRAVPRDSDLTGYVAQVASSLDESRADPQSIRAGLGLFCVSPQQCFEDHGREG